jgi:beta-galactosidase
MEKGAFRITNRHNFTNLNELQGSWEVLSNGTAAGQGTFQVDCAPGNTTLVELPLSWKNTDPGDDLLVTISFALKEGRPWAEAGHEIAWEQFPVSAGFSHPPGKPGWPHCQAAFSPCRPGYLWSHCQAGSNTPPAGRVTSGPTASRHSAKPADIKLPPVAIERTSETIVVTGKDFHYVIDARTGAFKSMNFKGTELLTGPGFDLTVWRAPIANDMDPWGAGSFTRTNYTAGLGRSIDNQLRTLGLDNLEPRVYESKTNNLETGEALVSLVIYSVGSTLNSGFREDREYIFAGDGSVRLNHKITPHGPMPSLLPKLGIRLLLPENFRNIEWYGRGPFETYPDRKTGAKTGVWSSTVDDEYVPYIIPQDHGNKTDTRWIKISSDDNSGLFISGSELFNFSVHNHSTDNLTRAVHRFQLEKAGFVTLNVDYEVTGVGGTAIRTLAKYQVRPAVREYSLTIEPFRNL